MKINWYNSQNGIPNEDMNLDEFKESNVTERLAIRTINEHTFETIDDLKKSQYSVEFSSKTENYCIGLVDMIDSTKISARIGWARSTRYYQLFLNSMSEILKRFGGFVIKKCRRLFSVLFSRVFKKR